VLNAVTDIANAYALFKSSNDPVTLFRTVMQIDSRGDIYLEKEDRVNCFTDLNQENTRTIYCSDSLPITKFILVHEFGHVFDNASDQDGNIKLSQRVIDKGVVDINNAWVMGSYPVNEDCLPNLP